MGERTGMGKEAVMAAAVGAGSLFMVRSTASLCFAIETSWLHSVIYCYAQICLWILRPALVHMNLVQCGKRKVRNEHVLSTEYLQNATPVLFVCPVLFSANTCLLNNFEI